MDGTGGQGDQELGRSRGGFGTKIHVAVNGQGKPVWLILTPGQSAALLDGLTPKVVIADKGYDSRTMVTLVR